MAQLTKGALLQTRPGAPPRIWVFPFNPDTLHHHWVTPELDPAVRRVRHRMSVELVLDEPFELPPNAALAVTVLSPATPEHDSERAEWAALGVQCLARAYGDDEPEYTVADLRP